MDLANTRVSHRCVGLVARFSSGRPRLEKFSYWHYCLDSHPTCLNVPRGNCSGPGIFHFSRLIELAVDLRRFLAGERVRIVLRNTQ